MIEAMFNDVAMVRHPELKIGILDHIKRESFDNLPFGSF